MAIRTALLTSRNINKDTDFSKYIETVSDPWVIKGLEVSTTKVAIGQAWVPCERTNGETIYSLVQNCSEFTISGSGYVVIQVDQTIIDDGGGNEDGTGIASISVVQTLPTKNYLLLAQISGGVVTDRRNMLHTIGDISTQVDSLTSRITQAEIDIQEIQEKWAIDHLEETGLVWELYNLSNTLFKQATPTLENSTLEVNVWDLAANTQIHIQRMTSKTASNSIKLKVKKVWAPTTSIIVEVRNAIQVDVSETEAYWYWGGTLICSGSIPYTSTGTERQEITVNMNGTFGGVQGQIVDVVVYQQGNIVNSTNYYVLACDSTQYSEAFSYVSVNGETRTRSKLMPYCLSDGFVQYMLCKFVSNPDFYLLKGKDNTEKSGSNNAVLVTYNVPFDWKARVSGDVYVLNQANIYIRLNGANVQQWRNSGNAGRIQRTTNIENVKAWDVITIVVSSLGSQYNATHYSSTFEVAPVSKGLKVMPRSLKDIWLVAENTLVWKHIDDKYYGGIMLGKTTSATTGNITLWNAVGFIEINFNGENMKIPYFS